MSTQTPSSMEMSTKNLEKTASISNTFNIQEEITKTNYIKYNSIFTITLIILMLYTTIGTTYNLIKTTKCSCVNSSISDELQTFGSGIINS